MSDFLVNIGNRHSPEDLLALLKRPYGKRSPNGQCFSFPWGSMAVLNDRFADDKNIISKNKMVFAWVGDLIGKISDTLLSAIIDHLDDPQRSKFKQDISLQGDELFEKLNGAFAIIVAGEYGFCIITDPMSFTQLFMGIDRNGRKSSFGTHSDLVATISDASEGLDLVSIAQLLTTEYCTFPNTMYTNVKELEPGSLHFMNLKEVNRPIHTHFSYWRPPEEARSGYNEIELADELCEALLASVQDRCSRPTSAVALSGGLDSRLVMAAIPKEVECLGLTLCDKPNRETKTAKKVAAAYGRKWFPLFRGKDYIADNLVDMVKFIGFECDFIHAHLFGFANLINRKTTTLFTGDLFDTLFRAYCAKDFIYARPFRWVPLGNYKKIHFAYPYGPDHLLADALKDNIVEGLNARWKSFYEKNIDQRRGSIAEWVKIYPFRQWVEVSTWAAQRRVLPLRLIGADRRLLDFAFRCPVELKLGDKIFLMVAKKICGNGLHIPSANDGVRPCSHYLWRLAQRAIRKFENGTTKILEKLGKSPKIQHSWHDYQKYWRESNGLAQLIQEYGSNLDQFDGILFKSKGIDLLERKDIDWHCGFRLLQLAIWLKTIKGYKTIESHFSVPLFESGKSAKCL